MEYKENIQSSLCTTGGTFPKTPIILDPKYEYKTMPWNTIAANYCRQGCFQDVESPNRVDEKPRPSKMCIGGWEIPRTDKNRWSPGKYRIDFFREAAMNKRVEFFIRVLGPEKWKLPEAIFIAIGTIVLVFMADFFTPNELAFSFFYLLPVAISMLVETEQSDI